MTAEPEPALVPHEVVTRLTAIWSTSPWAASAAIYAALAQLALGWRDRASLVAAGPGGEERLVAPELGAWAGTRELAALAADAADVVDELCADGGPIELRAEAGGRLPPECPALTVALSPAGLSFRSGEAGAQTAHAVAAAARQCADGRRTAAEVDWLTPEQRARVEDSLTGRSVDGEFVPVHELFERTADRRPDAIALAFEDQAITYAELEDGANRLAHHLRSLGAGPERLVGVCHDRGPQLVRSLLAVLKTGAAYVPLDPHFPAERLQAILEEAQPSVVLCDDDRVHVLGKRAPAVVVPGRDEGSIRARPSGRLARVTTPDDAMYVIYTSGSTGRPKGIVQVHRAISNLVAWQTHSSGIDHEGPVLQFSSLGFDVHLQELFPTFARGGTVCLTRRENLLDPRRLAGVLARHSVRTVFLSVSTLTRLFDSGRELSSLPATLTDVVTAGEQLHVGHSLAAFLAARPALRLHNHYGVSESHVVTARWVAGGGRVEPRAPIGRPIWNCRLRLLSPDLRAVPPGAVGEVWIAGDCLARHYLGREEETAAYFQQLDGERWYKTRDLARLLPSGELEFMGRIDDQLKVRGHLVEPGEVEAAMRALPGIEECAVGPVAEASGGTALAAWYTGPGPLAVDRLRSALAGRLPDFMVPAHFVHVATLPTGATGKVDRGRLPSVGGARPALETAYAAPSTGLQELIAGIASDLLGIESVGVDDNFFDLGGSSLTLAAMASAVGERVGRAVSPLDLYRHSTVRRLAHALGAEPGADDGAAAVRRRPAADEPIAIIGMAGRFPGADSVEVLWRRLLAGEECLTVVPEEQREAPVLLPAGGQRRVTRIGPLDGAEDFDAGFFGLSPADADWMDPQHRVLLECAWAALEDAGCPPDAVPRVGVFAGCEVDSYLLHVQPRIGSMADYLRALVATDKDFLATRVAYLLGLHGPALTVQTACSTSLLAVHLACRSLHAGECEVALAGGSSLVLPQRSGHPHEPGLIYSADGRTRPFDAAADGTNTTNGVAVVVLKPLDAALRDGDRVYAVIRGSAVNNDGNRKVGFAAPSVEGQRAVVRDALDAAGVSADTIRFVEAHGTATPIGDAVELQALHEAYRPDTERRRFCAIGSIKSNVGHLNRAAGAAALIKAALAVHTGQLPPSINFASPNPELHLGDGPFFVPADTLDLRGGEGPIRAGVSAFGIGGTNVHVVIEEPPAAPVRPRVSGAYPVALSAHTRSALGRRARELADRMERPPAPDMADVAHTCNIGRTALPVRACVVAATTDALVRELRSIGEADMGQAGVARVAFVFPGQGGQVAGAGQALAARYPVFRTAVEEAVEAATEPVRQALRQLLLDELPAADQARLLARSEVAQPWLVALGRALTFLCMDWGIRPAAVAGHSTGEYTAACVAGGLSLRDCMAMVAERGRLMDEEAPTGAMLSVLLPAGEIGPWLADGLLVAGRNSRDHTLVAGSVEAVASLADRLAASGVPVRRLNNHNANHSALLDPIVAPFRTAVGGAAPMELRIPMVSTLTGSWLEDGPDIDHWCAHLTSPVDLAAALDRLADRGITHLVELGPSGGLPSLAGYHYAARPGPVALASMASRDGPDEVTALQRVVGRLWRDGAAVEWRRVNGEDGGRTVSLPAYPFERRRHWMPPPSPAGGPISQADAPVRRAPSEWLYEERWERLPLPPAHEVGDVDGTWLVVSGGGRLSRSIAAALRRDGCRVVWAEHAACFVAHRDRHALDWTDAAQRHRLAGALAAKGVRPDRMLLFSAAADGLEARADAGPAWEAAAVTAALAARRPVSGGPVRALLVTRGAVSASSGEAAEPMEAALRALRVVAPQEDPDLDLRQVDLAPGGRGETRLVLAELSPRADEPEVAIRGRRRLAPSWRRVPEAPEPAPLRRGGRYLVTGGLGAVGTELAAHLLMELEATVLVLGSRPVAELADGPGAARLRRLTGLAARSGGTVRYVAADVADQGSLAAAMAPLLREGPLHGVFHLAARIEGRAFQRLLAECDRQVLEKQLAPKLLGLRSLDAVLDGHATDFRLAFSSISTVLGGLGYLPYSISNLALVAEAIRRPGWTVADWDIWETPDDEPERDLRASALRGTGMEPADALGRLRQVLAGSRRRTLVSTVDLSERLAHVRARLAGAVDREDRPAAAPVQVDDPAPVDGSLEDVVAAVWSRVLHSEARPRPESHFAELGGDSLSAIKVALELSARLDVRVGAADMLQATSFADFCARVRARTAADNGRPAIQPQRSSAVDAGRPVSPLEERWLHMEPRGFGYLDVPVLIEGRLDPGAMRTAVATVWGRHETLHGRYELAPDGQPRYVAEPGWRPDLEVVDLRHIGPAALPQALHSCLADLQRRRFDLYAEVPWAVRLVLLDEARSLLFGRTHHAVFDGWSATLVAEELDVAYCAIAGGQEPSLPSAPQYGEFAAGQRRYLEGAEILEDRRYWRDVFAGCDGPTCLPGDRTDVGSTAARRVTRRVASLAAGRLRRAAAAAGVTLFGVLSAAFARLLADATGEPDIVFGTTAAGRYEPGTERTVGVFVNPLPVRVPVRGGQAHLLRAAHDALIGFHEHQRYLLADLVAHVPPFAGRDINDTFSAYLLLQNYPRPRDQGLLRYRLLETDTVLEDPVLAAVQKDGASLMREFELVVYEESDGALTLNFWYRTATFGREAAGGLADRYVRLVSELAGAAAAD